MKTTLPPFSLFCAITPDSSFLCQVCQVLAADAPYPCCLFAWTSCQASEAKSLVVQSDCSSLNAPQVIRMFKSFSQVQANPLAKNRYDDCKGGCAGWRCSHASATKLVANGTSRVPATSSRADLTSLTPASHVMISKYHVHPITHPTATAPGQY